MVPKPNHGTPQRTSRSTDHRWRPGCAWSFESATGTACVRWQEGLSQGLRLITSFGSEARRMQLPMAMASQSATNCSWFVLANFSRCGAAHQASNAPRRTCGRLRGFWPFKEISRTKEAPLRRSAVPAVGKSLSDHASRFLPRIRRGRGGGGGGGGVLWGTERKYLRKPDRWGPEKGIQLHEQT